MLVIKLTGKAEEVFKLFATLANKYPNRTIGQIARGYEDAGSKVS